MTIGNQFSTETTCFTDIACLSLLLWEIAEKSREIQFLYTFCLALCVEF